MPFEFGNFSFGLVAGGAVVGVINHFLAKSRDIESRTAKDFNEVADALSKILNKEKVFPTPQGCIIDFFAFRRVLSDKEMACFDRSVEKFENAKKNTEIKSTKNNDSGYLFYYHDTTSIEAAIDELIKFTIRK